MADNVWALNKAIKGDAVDAARGRSDSDPGAQLADVKALDIAVPGGFRRDHLQKAPKKVSKALRNQIADKIASVYDPFIGNVLSQDNDTYDELEMHEKIQNLLQTPVLHQRLPITGYVLCTSS